MKNIFLAIVLISLVTLLSGCAETAGQNLYDAGEVGKQADIVFGKILAVRHVKVQAEPSGVGTAAGMAGGGLAGTNVGNGNGTIGAVIAGAIIGGIAGSAAEKAMADRVGVEYIIRKEDGKTISIVQNISKDDVPLKVGQRVMIQTSGEYQKASGKKHSAQYQRVLPAGEGM
ncbi:MAG: hypothetical protein HY052_08540 [Proteobacteria bacterium]|nr:hypothetical protein [Pseudomonadota bacterium]